MSGTTTPLESEHSNAPTRCQASSPGCARPGRTTQAAGGRSPGGFTALPNAVLLAPGLSRDARFLYAVLLYHARQDGRCFPSHATLAAALGAGETMVRAYLRELLDAGLVTQRRRGQGKTNLYRLCGPQQAEAMGSGPGRAETAGPEPPAAAVHGHHASEGGATAAQGERGSRTPGTALLGPRAPAADEDAGDKDRDLDESTVRHRQGPRAVPRRPRAHTPPRGEARVDGGTGELEDAERPPAGAGAGEGPLPAPPRQDPAYRTVAHRLRALTEEFGDPAPPGANIARASRLLASSGLGCAAFLALLDEAAAITRSCEGRITKRCAGPGGARKNLMPYCFAVLEDLLQRQGHPAAGPCPPRGGAEGRGEVRRDAATTRPAGDGPGAPCAPAWREVLAELRQVLTPPTFARCLAGRPVRQTEAQLWVELPDRLTLHWFETRLRRRIEAALASAGHGHLRLRLVLPTARGPGSEG